MATRIAARSCRVYRASALRLARIGPRLVRLVVAAPAWPASG